MSNALIHVALLSALLGPAAHSQTSKSLGRKYAPIEDYLMPQASEVALAKSAAPANISDHTMSSSTEMCESFLSTISITLTVLDTRSVLEWAAARC